MKLVNQVKILKEHGFVFAGVTGWRYKSARYELPGSRFSMPLKKTQTKAGLLKAIEGYKVLMEQREQSARDRTAYLRRKGFRALDGGRPWWKPKTPIANLKLVA